MCSLKHQCFNPHQPKRAGETSQAPTCSHLPKRFQSAPAQKGWCNAVTMFHECRACGSFNPHQPKRAGETSAHLEAHITAAVSIRTSPKGLVKHLTLRQMHSIMILFQSAPAQKGW